MVTFGYAILLIVGLILVIFGGNFFVDSSIVIAKKTKIPTLLIGATIVAIATTLPELIVSLLAASKQNYGLAVGNVLGSVISNTALICGISITALPVVLKEKASPIKYIILIFTCVLFALFGIDFNISLAEGLILLLIFLLFMTINIQEAIGENKQHKKNIEKSFEIVTTQTAEKDCAKNNWLTAFYFILGAGMIAGGAYALVEGATFVGTSLGISSEFLGITIVGLGTSLPELVTAIISIKKKNSALGYGNIIGANILNLTLLIGGSSMFAGTIGLPMSTLTLWVSIPLTLIVTLLFVVPLMLKKKTYRWQGICLLSIFLLYYIYLIVMTVLGYTV